MLESRHAVIERLRQKAREIAARQPQADFYRDFPQKVTRSGYYFQTDPVICRLHAFVAGAIENDFGHGLAHAQKVALDAGALMAIEGERAAFAPPLIGKQMRLAHCAGLLHDIERKQKDHARHGAIYARRLLVHYPFTSGEISDIATAIANHEAFGSPLELSTRAGQILSDSLYDSDKFRFGPDNFTHTVWDMIELSGVSMERFVTLYPRGIEFLKKIRHTFRTPTGQKYGPQFIDIGIAIGEELYLFMTQELAL